nr:hypothetical protein CFP56_57106 [Quercus suber]
MIHKTEHGTELSTREQREASRMQKATLKDPLGYWIAPIESLSLLSKVKSFVGKEIRDEQSMRYTTA